MKIVSIMGRIFHRYDVKKSDAQIFVTMWLLSVFLYIVLTIVRDLLAANGHHFQMAYMTSEYNEFKLFVRVYAGTKCLYIVTSLLAVLQLCGVIKMNSDAAMAGIFAISASSLAVLPEVYLGFLGSLKSAYPDMPSFGFLHLLIIAGTPFVLLLVACLPFGLDENNGVDTSG